MKDKKQTLSIAESNSLWVDAFVALGKANKKQTSIWEIMARVKDSHEGAYREDVPPLNPDNGILPMFGIECRICGDSSIVGRWEETCPSCNGTIPWDTK